MTPDEVIAFLSDPRTAVLSTLHRDGGPHSAGMWFWLDTSTDPASVRMWTYAKSQKAVNVMRDSRSAFLVEEGMAYSALRGVLIRGEAEVVTDYEAVKQIGMELYELYSLPATGVPADQGPVNEIERQAAKRVGIALPLIDVASWDHRRLSN